jgi:hypothetical protein
VVRYKSFRIRNFKGIKDTTVSLESIAGVGVFAFVGLNESGKTTVLEAIHSYSPESSTSELLGGEEGTGVPFKERVPRHSISFFTGYVSVEGTILLTEKDKDAICDTLKSEEAGFELNKENIPNEVVLERQQQFENGDFKGNFHTLRTVLQVRSAKQRRWRSPTTAEGIKIRDVIHNAAPDIAYFPTFVFDFPEAVFLTDRGNEVDRFYRRVFQDILDYDNQGHKIQRDIVQRVRAETLLTPWTAFLSAWSLHDDREKIQHVMDRASAAVTRLIFGRWNKIFGEDTKNKEIAISFEILEGETQDEKTGLVTKTNKHDVSIKFQIKDGTRRFNVNDRSLGFRWFFAFMLFTQFRVARSRSRPLLFLFDEPASNLHAAAQQKLIDSFPEIARGDHMLAYSTHSHYMIEPKWLEQTFIVTNRADAPIQSVLDDASLDDESLDIKVATYRSFVNEHPNQTNYFQPILDRLEVVPSRFDMQRASIILEGKSDYYILRYLIKTLNLAELPLLPALGAGTFGALAALHVGWNLNFLFVVDGDKQGKLEKSRYSRDFGIPENRIATIDELVSGVTVIEDLLDDKALAFVKTKLDLETTPTKAQIRRFFQEGLASGQFENLSEPFLKNGKRLLDALNDRLAKSAAPSP